MQNPFFVSTLQESPRQTSCCLYQMNKDSVSLHTTVLCGVRNIILLFLKFKMKSKKVYICGVMLWEFKQRNIANKTTEQICSIYG